MKRHFGTLLCSLRESRNIGVRQFARMIDVKPSNYCNLENGFLKAPKPSIVHRIIETLGLNSDEATMLFDAVAESRDEVPVDIREFIKENPLVPCMLRSMRKKKLTDEEISSLMDDLNKIPEEIDECNECFS